MALIILRCVFLICAGGVTAIINSLLPSGTSAWLPWITFITIMTLASIIVIGDI